MEFEVHFETPQFRFSIGKRWKRSNAAKRLPPSPSKLPIVGNMNRLIVSQPHHTLRKLAQKHKALMHLQLGEISSIVISSPCLAKEILKTHDLAFAIRTQFLSAKIICYKCSDIAVREYGDYWRHMRKTVLILKLHVCRAALGRNSHPLFSLKSKLLDVRHKLDTVLDSIIDHHIDNLAWTKTATGEFDHKNLTDALLRVKERGDLQFLSTNDDIKAVLMVMFFLVTFSSYALQVTPSCSSRFLENAGRNVKLMDISFPTNKMPGQLEDPKFWDDLDSNKPKRFENNSIDFNGSHSEYVPFGAGRRICPGIPFGFANIELPLALLLYHFNRKLLNGPISSDFDMEDLVRIIAPTKKNLRLLATLYDPSPDLPTQTL
ncbi:premnaspirodiene oxygenase-like [Coffea arabica]|uniref:Premnaspirodiene oxygenase-like n=1 Tax=Coffea arabica TaxID=13443 RepID=A0A6P6TYY8_COFAR|nr:cytochrome P450 71D7-like [Coffea arabica]